MFAKTKTQRNCTIAKTFLLLSFNFKQFLEAISVKQMIDELSEVKHKWSDIEKLPKPD